MCTPRDFNQFVQKMAEPYEERVKARSKRGAEQERALTSPEDPLATEPPPVPRTLGIIASGNVAGAIAGLIVGGIGSRLAMRILALTSPGTQGVLTQAEEVVGEITLAGTLFLLGAGAALGVGGGLAYVAIRRWLPSKGTGLVFGLLMLAVSGRPLVDPENIDFVVLDPAWLGITMFASLPILFGLLIVPLQAKLEPIFTKARSGIATTLVLVAGLAPLAIGGPVALIIVSLIAVGLLVARSPTLREAWDTTTVDICGRAVLGATGIFGLGLFAWGALEILV
jgi:hypothetical protein